MNMKHLPADRSGLKMNALGIQTLIGTVCILTLCFWTASAQAQNAEVSLVKQVQIQNAEVRLNARSPDFRPSYLSDLTSRIERGPASADEVASSDGAAGTASILVLDQPLTRERRAELSDGGIQFEEYLGGSTYLVILPRALSDATLFSLESFTEAGADYSPADKVRPGALDLPPETENVQQGLMVEFFSAVDPAIAVAELRKIDIAIIRQEGTNSYFVAARPDQAAVIAEIPLVKSIDGPPAPFLPLNATARRVSGTDQAQLFRMATLQPRPRFDGVTGRGIRVGVSDNGVDQNHNDFAELTSTGEVGSSRVYNQRSVSDSHGTHVASIVGGNGLNSAANGYPAFSRRGHAPEALIGDYGHMGTVVAPFHASIVNDQSVITNHSYVQSLTSSYDAGAATLDRIVRGDVTHNSQKIPAAPQVWAAGNNGVSTQYGNNKGYYSTFSSAKNTISVGSIDTIDVRLSDFSSLGPTFDGRIKPDISAPGCNDSISNGLRIEAANRATQGYTGKCGTSMAAPVVSGVLALMMDRFQREFGDPATLLPSTYKAMLVHTARDLVKLAPHPDREFSNPDTGEPVIFHAGPDFATGYGLVEGFAAVNLIADRARWQEVRLEQTGQNYEACMQIPGGADEIKATIAWDDQPGSTITATTNTKLVNDLDLVLIGPTGAQVLPWTLEPLPLGPDPIGTAADPISKSDVHPARRGADHRNNVEMANTSSPDAGKWTVRITAFNLPLGMEQKFSLATSHPVGPC